MAHSPQLRNWFQSVLKLFRWTAFVAISDTVTATWTLTAMVSIHNKPRGLSKNIPLIAVFLLVMLRCLNPLKYRLYMFQYNVNVVNVDLIGLPELAGRCRSLAEPFSHVFHFFEGQIFEIFFNPLEFLSQ
jgi:hypothetical protein